MAGNFNISLTKTGDQVYLKLIGDFDGTSACELVNLLTNGDISRNSTIQVDTDSLRVVYPFGLNVLRNRLHIENSSNLPLTFTGKLSTQFTAN